MIFTGKNKGKITISIDREGDKLNSNIEFTGIAREKNVTMTTLLINFVSYCVRNGYDPKQSFNSRVDDLLKVMREVK